MDSLEIKKQLQLSYSDLVEYLLQKYGKAQYNYFCGANCASFNSKVKRISEGLFCHHINEDKVGALCDKDIAIKNPYSYQMADGLVYCNVLEHLILHIKIIEEQKKLDSDKIKTQRHDGIMQICWEINQYFSFREIKAWQEVCYKLIDNNFEDYINIFKHFLFISEKSSDLEFISKISLGNYYEIVERVYSALSQPDSGTEAIFEEAEAIFKHDSKAAESGNAQAQYNLGVYYETGMGVRQNRTVAIEWHKKSAEQGHYTAQRRLCCMYALGDGVPRNENEAKKWDIKSQKNKSKLSKKDSSDKSTYGSTLVRQINLRKQLRGI